MENRAEQLLESYFANSISSTELEELRALAAADAAVADEIAFQQRIAASVQKAALAKGTSAADVGEGRAFLRSP